MQQVFIKRGRAVVEQVPSPALEPGTVLVRVSHSCISSGTELSGVRNSGEPLWKRALKHPEEVQKVVTMAAGQGIGSTVSVVRGRLAEGLVVGYSAAGIVEAVSTDVDEFGPGDRVACAGTGHASHAQLIRVPRNLVARMPDGVSFAHASTVALGAIALQGVRRANPTLGETFVVVGLGALGQLATQLLKANGCRVIGTDINPDRIALARGAGLDVGLDPSDGDADLKVLRVTRDLGADGVIITASGAGDEIVSSAFRMCRRRGRVVLVGDVGLALKRQDIYEKELDFLVSTSYGPGRYDADFEVRGLKYPLAYVRWTETENMAAFLDLVSAGRVSLTSLIGGEFPVAEAQAAYTALETKERPPILALLKYGTSEEIASSAPVQVTATRSSPKTRIGVAVVGPGGFAKAVHLPNLTSLRDYFDIRAVVSHSAPRASQVSRQFGGYPTTDLETVLADPAVDALVVCTRHNLHASMALRGLRAGKHVLLEKPLALTRAELAEVEAFYAEAGPSAKPVLLTGFNRRFSPHAQRARALVSSRTSPMVMTYRMNAGHIPPEHWVHGVEGGGRNLGEACHIYDLFTYLTDARVTSVAVQAIPPPSGHRARTDNFMASLRFEDGSIACLTYTSLGHRSYPKEHLEVFVDGRVLVVDDYLELSGEGFKDARMKNRVPDKGHLEELRQFASGLRSGTWPIPLWQQVQATEIALTVQDELCGRAG
ncbi:MAG: bi-domain-containing oxidoreductase [Myxococcales bacterium]|nr:bi-domain-containing oxidoreductase [Myxococcales bacterium]